LEEEKSESKHIYCPQSASDPSLAKVQNKPISEKVTMMNNSGMTGPPKETTEASGSAEAVPKKKRGRPPKNKSGLTVAPKDAETEAGDEPAPKKKKGRPPKETTEAGDASKKKRGRPPKKTVEAGDASKKKGRPQKKTVEAGDASKKKGRPQKKPHDKAQKTKKQDLSAAICILESASLRLEAIADGLEDENVANALIVLTSDMDASVRFLSKIMKGDVVLERTEAGAGAQAEAGAEAGAAAGAQEEAEQFSDASYESDDQDEQ
jgi:hypothetical protein